MAALTAIAPVFVKLQKFGSNISSERSESRDVISLAQGYSPMFYFYIVRCSDNSLYCGQTNDLEKRIKEHNSGSARSAKYTKARHPVTLIYSENYSTLQSAMKREWQIKQWSRAKKEALVKSDKITLEER